ncbi:MAG: hypothetical protein ACOX0C_02175 [Patescibacteria group bacterium]|jgi:hypothetical protein
MKNKKPHLRLIDLNKYLQGRDYRKLDREEQDYIAKEILKVLQPDSNK